jgi:hypothetical protein
MLGACLEDGLIEGPDLAACYALLDAGEVRALSFAFGFLADGIIEGAERGDARAAARHAFMQRCIGRKVRIVLPYRCQYLGMLGTAAMGDPALPVGGIEGGRIGRHAARPGIDEVANASAARQEWQGCRH